MLMFDVRSYQLIKSGPQNYAHGSLELISITNICSILVGSGYGGYAIENMHFKTISEKD